MCNQTGHTGILTGSGQHFVGQRQPIRGDDQGDDDLHAVGAFVTAVAEAALVAFREGGIGLKIGAGHVVEQDVKVRVEQVAPAVPQMAEQGGFVGQQPVMAGIQGVDGAEVGLGSEQVWQGGAV